MGKPVSKLFGLGWLFGLGFFCVCVECVLEKDSNVQSSWAK